MPPLYYSVRETDSYADATLHADRDCFDGPARAAPSALEGDRCPECTDADAESDEPEDDGDEVVEHDTCQEVLTSGDREGEVCGRDRPCRFHD